MSYSPIDLDGASVAVTGGARGIGAAITERLRARGARVLVGDLSGGDVELDVRDPDSYAAFMAAAEAAHGPLDVLVNNAGVMPNGPFLELDDATNRMVLEVNLMGVITGMRLALPGMVERRRGHVVNVASLAGKVPLKGLAVYNASKFAVVGLTAATRLEMAPHGVSVTAVLPSAVDTALASGLDLRPLPKVSPDQVAAAVEGSVASRGAEIAVPRYIGVLADAAMVTPTPVLDLLRRAVRDDRALRSDSAERTAYRDRLREEAR